MAERGRRYALCVQVEKDEDLQLRKVYEVLPDERAARLGYLRVIDESGEDYLYPGEAFVMLELPRKAERALATPARKGGARHANQALQQTGSARR